MSSVDADINSSSGNDYGQYDDLEAALVIAAADADARNHVRVEEQQREQQEDDGGEQKQEYEESLGYYQNDEQKVKEKEQEPRRGLKRKLSGEEDEVGTILLIML